MPATILKKLLPAPVVAGLAKTLEQWGIRDRVGRTIHGFNPETGLAVDVAVYYPDNVAKLYQLTQWLPVFENHPDDLRFGLVVRNYNAYLELKGKTSLPIAHVPNFPDLMELYRVSTFTAVVYVNNGVGNFQSLTVPELVHVHVNHGESDKICMVSNQVKAYDRVFVAGEAAVQRHRAALSEFNTDLLVRVGRPQLDEHPAPSLAESTRTTIMFAPTWAGEDEANNYTSMETMGAAIAAACLAQPNVRFIYKPHPRVLDSSDARISENNARVVTAIERAVKEDPSAGHAVLMKGDILALFPRTDVLISDVSSVALDFLYLRPEMPIIMTDRRDDIKQLRIDAPLSVATEVITPSNVEKAAAIIAGVLAHDEHAEHRHQLREFYFDNVRSGESTNRFFNALREAMTTHRADMERARDLARRGTGPQLQAKG